MEKKEEKKGNSVREGYKGVSNDIYNILFLSNKSKISKIYVT